MIAPMYKSVEGTLANMGNMPKQYWNNIAPILGAIGGEMEPHHAGIGKDESSAVSTEDGG